MSQDFSRKDRVAELIRRELALLVGRELQDPRVKEVTVNEVTLSRDLGHARVYISALDPKQIPDALKGLKSAAGFLRHELGKRVELRTVPELRFQYDDTQVRAERLDALIDQARREDIAHGADEPTKDRRRGPVEY